MSENSDTRVTEELPGSDPLSGDSGIKSTGFVANEIPGEDQDAPFQAAREFEGPESPSETSSIPDWFQRKRARQQEQQQIEPRLELTETPPRPSRKSRPLRRAEPKIIVQTEDEVDARPWKERVIAWLRSSAAAAYLLSALIHATGLLALSILIATASSGGDKINTLIVSNSDENHDQPGFDEIPELRIDTDGGQTNGLAPDAAALEAMTPLPSSLDLSRLESSDLQAKSSGKGQGQGQDDTVGDGSGGGGFAMPAAGKAVTKGSFTAWTVPDDPAPGEDYLIVIQVELSRKGLRLKRGDVTGTVVGTDGFRLLISPFTSKYIPKTNQLVIPVPGADARVRDIIKVRSQMLKESQQLEIEF